MDTIANIIHLTSREKIYGDELDDNKRTILLDQEQKREALIKTLMNKYTQPGTLFSILC